MAAKKKKLRGTIESRTNRDGSTSYRCRVMIDGERISSPWLDSELDAVQAQIEINQNGRRTGGEQTLAEAWERWFARATHDDEKQREVNRNQRFYKPSTLRSYADSMRVHVLPDLGKQPIDSLDAPTLTRFTERMKRSPARPGASSVRNAITAIRVVLGYHVLVGDLKANGAAGLRLAPAGKREVVLTPEQARKLIEALPEAHRALWATAMWGGLRRGELGALRWCDVDLIGQTISVTRSWDWPTGEAVEPKSAKGWRTVGIPDVLLGYLVAHGEIEVKGEEGARAGEDLIFGRTRTQAFTPAVVTKAADAAWAKAKLERVTLHGARHAFASLALAAGFAVEDLQETLGHGSYGITMDRYAKRQPGAKDADVVKLNALL